MLAVAKNQVSSEFGGTTMLAHCTSTAVVKARGCRLAPVPTPSMMPLPLLMMGDTVKLVPHPSTATLPYLPLLVPHQHALSCIVPANAAKLGRVLASAEVRHIGKGGGINRALSRCCKPLA